MDGVIFKPTVFVLGAGASVPYGFPTGYDLASKILKAFREDEAVRRAIVGAGGDGQLMADFVRVYPWAACPS
jgi:hypothetical protein